MAADVEGRFMRVVVLQVFAPVTVTSRYGIPVPDQSEMSPVGGDQFVGRHETFVDDVLPVLSDFFIQSFAVNIEFVRRDMIVQLIKECIFPRTESSGIDHLGDGSDGTMINCFCLRQIIEYFEASHGYLASLLLQPAFH